MPPAKQQNVTLPTKDAGGVATLANLHDQILKPPSLYQVVLINDDFTPMDFVILILQKIFNKDHQTATTITEKVHTEGRAVCAVYTREVAQTKVAQVMQSARAFEHPLQCIFEPVVPT